MATEPPISDEEVIAALTANGRTVDDYFILDGLLPGFATEKWSQVALLIEDDALAAACVQFLRRRGARVVQPGSGG
jgi:hypothetical protein